MESNGEKHIRCEVRVCMRISLHVGTPKHNNNSYSFFSEPPTFRGPLLVFTE